MLPVHLAETLGEDWASLEQQLRDWPRPLRSAAVEVVAVVAGLKPVARVTSSEDAIGEVLKVARHKGLYAIVKKTEPARGIAVGVTPAENRAFHHVFLTAREDLVPDLTGIAQDEKAAYRELGQMLGYPDCCIAWASSADNVRTGDCGFVRQTNLAALALERSSHIPALTNCLARESAITAHTPATLLSHSPCSFECRPSLALAKTYLDAFVCQFPEARGAMERLLTLPLLWWSDEAWTAQFAAEYPGLLLLGRGVTGSHFIPLSGAPFPSGPIPESGRLHVITDEFLLAGDTRIDFEVCGRPRLIEPSAFPSHAAAVHPS